MEIYLWRHGRAQDPSHLRRDVERELTDQGKNDIVKVARKIRRHIWNEVKMFSSPYIRARQTAYVLQLMIECDGPIEILDQLASGAQPQPLMEELRQRDLRMSDKVLLVGHMPDLGKIAAFLLKSREEISFRPGSVAKISTSDLEPGRASLELFLSPDEL